MTMERLLPSLSSMPSTSKMNLVLVACRVLIFL
jgi:hypothetical protein